MRHEGVQGCRGDGLWFRTYVVALKWSRRSFLDFSFRPLYSPDVKIVHYTRYSSHRRNSHKNPVLISKATLFKYYG